MNKYKLILLSSVIGMVSNLAYGETINIQCSCKTKTNPSACSINTQEYQVIEWNQDAYTNPDINWDKKMLSKYCQRHKHIGCMCEGSSIYSGEVAE